MRGEVVEEVLLDDPSFFDTSQFSVLFKYKVVVAAVVVVAVHVDDDDDDGGVEEDMVVERREAIVENE
ncbi:hypothetical protein DEO72_LG6g3218 [Vigna unguiculata]|uniref:Uncharacterized protein n=1 Tax=Vigna unguiculata TaxID=3917 RepID=A0A4D6MBY2_VIGUN|nr:hypothetical protein DEO72_LG6g3218 [Vigna unguiculata]